MISLLVSLMLACSGWTQTSKTAKKEKYGSNIKVGTELPILAGALIQVDSYDPKTKTYEVFSVTFPGEGNSRVSTVGLAKSMKHLTAKKLREKPRSIVGQQFKLDNDLPTFANTELKKRKRLIKRKAIKK